MWGGIPRKKTKGDVKMAVSAGILYEVRGEAAKRIIQEIDRPTIAQITQHNCISQQVKGLADLLRLKARK